MKGRKKKQESQAIELRQKLVAWKQTPESMRPSLRALAGELATSHQMLAYYLDGLDRWQAEERAKQICARAEAEGRAMTMRECCHAIIAPGFYRRIENLKHAAKRGPLNHWQIKMLKQFASQGFSGAEEVLRTCRQMTPQEERQARASERAADFAAAATKSIKRIKQDGERGPLCWQDIERLKYFARRKYPEASDVNLVLIRPKPRSKTWPKRGLVKIIIRRDRGAAAKRAS